MTVRRDFLAMTVGAVAARAVLSEAASFRNSSVLRQSPDTALIALCDTFAVACSEMRRLNAMEDPSDDELNAAVAAWDAPIDTIIATPACTAAGIQAKAQAMIGMFANGGVQKCRSETMDEAMGYHEKAAWVLAHEIVAMGRAA